MLVFDVELGHAIHRPTPPWLALVLPILVGIVGLIALSSRLVSTNTRRSVLNHLVDDEPPRRDDDVQHDNETATLLPGDGEVSLEGSKKGTANDDIASTSISVTAALHRVVLELLKVVGGASLIAVTIVKLMDEAVQARDIWTDVLDAGVLLVAVSSVKLQLHAMMMLITSTTLLDLHRRH